MQYRRVDDLEWRPGRTINMSVSGVLFQAKEPLDPDEAVELSIMFEATGRHIPSSLVTTTGHVVRTESKVPAEIAVKFAS
jgi:PilZ domain